MGLLELTARIQLTAKFHLRLLNKALSTKWLRTERSLILGWILVFLFRVSSDEGFNVSYGSV